MDAFPLYEPTHPVRRKKTTAGQKQVRKRTVKYLSVCRDPKAYTAVAKSAPGTVIKSICDAALNVQRGKHVSLTNHQKKLFRTHSMHIEALASRKLPLKRKRQIVAQKGGAFFIPALIGAALSGLGSLLFGGNKQQ